ncbi:MAG: N4-gp56 family major capsid protein [Chloroflexi bacterium]|nr:MAG: N4-gp56 family major capsid protein [Chloroflexota bacterium]
MADVLTSTAVLAADIVPVLIKERMLMLSERQMVLFGLAQKEQLPAGMGKTAQWTRYERLPLPTSPLAEGVTPNAIPLTTAIVQAIVDQWGSDVALTDMGLLTVRHPALRVAQERLGTQHGETVDREIQRVLNGGTNVTFAAGRTARSGLVAGDNPSTDLIRQIVANLRSQGAPPYEGGHYVGVVDPFGEMDLTKDATFVNAASYSNLRALLNGEIGMWMGVRWVRSNFLPILTYLQIDLGTSTGDTNFTQTSGDTTPVVHVAADTTTAAPSGGAKFAANATVVVEITRLDPQTGQEVVISKGQSVTNASAFVVRIEAASGFVAGTYNFYCSLSGSVVPLYQATFTYGSLADKTSLIVFALSGTAVLTAGSGASAPVVPVQATGAVAPPPAPQVGTAGGPNVHLGYVFGKESFGVLDLGGLETFLTPAVASDSDPLVQRRKVGWKQPWKAVVLNPNFYSRFETLSAFN